MTLSIPETIRVLMPNGAVKRMPLEEYVRGVLAAALAADAPLEAMKAQAVAARTFGATTRRHSERGADVCTLRHCQVWKDADSAATARAVQETRGIVATFAGQPIDAYYFDHCDGSTHDAAGVLVQAPSYLRGVSCACGFATLKGHGIGMCQSGALVMARFGDSFEVILKHYYSGITLEYTEGGASLDRRPPAADTKSQSDEREQTAPPEVVVIPARPEEPPPISARPPLAEPALDVPPAEVIVPTAETPPAVIPPSIEPSVPATSNATASSAEMPPSMEAALPDAAVAPAPEAKLVEPVEFEPASPLTGTAPEIAPSPATATPPAPVTLSQPSAPPIATPAELERSPAAGSALEKEVPAEPDAGPFAQGPVAPATKYKPPFELPEEPSWYPTEEEISGGIDTAAEREIDEALQAARENGAAAPVKSNALTPEPIAGETGFLPYAEPPGEALPFPAAPDSMPEEVGFYNAPPAPFPVLPAPDSMPEELIASAAPPAPIPTAQPPAVFETPKPVEPPLTPPPAEPPPTVAGEHVQASKPPLPVVQAPDVGEPAKPIEALPVVEETHEPIAPLPSDEAQPPGQIDIHPTPPTGAELPKPVMPPPPPPVAVELPRPVMPPPPPPPPVVGKIPFAVEQAPLRQGEPEQPAHKEIVLDRLPGPRVIAGDLSAPGIIVTIRDVAGNAVITVSGTAPHYGAGGFEAPLAEDGTYALTFDHHSVEIELRDETVIVCYSE